MCWYATIKTINSLKIPNLSTANNIQAVYENFEIICKIKAYILKEGLIVLIIQQ